MKRFYCNICKRVKRVRILPKIQTPKADNPTDRIGVCNRHESSYEKSLVKR